MSNMMRMIPPLCVFGQPRSTNQKMQLVNVTAENVNKVNNGDKPLEDEMAAF
jgi:hypothetical protein